MKNKGRIHKALNGNCKGWLTFITRDIRKVKPEKGESYKMGSYLKKKWSKRVRGYFKSQTKELL